MRKNITALAVMVLLTLSGAAVAGAQQAPALTTQDYIEIHELYARYNHAMDLGIGAGQGVADTFTEDGVLNKTTVGRQALVELAKRAGGGRGRHITTSIVLTPTPDGVKGQAYYFLVDASSREFNLMQGGQYDDTIVKTAKGWRFKTRQTNPVPPAAPAPAPAAAATPR